MDVFQRSHRDQHARDQHVRDQHARDQHVRGASHRAGDGGDVARCVT